MKLRKLEDSDKELIAQWTAADSDHKEYPPDWIYAGDKKERWMLEDSRGPVLAFRVSRVLRVDIQFNEGEKIRTASALIKGFAWLLERAQKAGFTEVIFDSKSKPLIAFCKKRFGFLESEHELVRNL